MHKQQIQNNQPILFYGKTDPQNYFLSNFYPSAFKIGNYVYQTNQHYFQAKKFVGKPEELEVIQAKDPRTAKALAKKYKPKRPENWADMKENVMLEGLRAKFGQNKELLQKLLATGDRELREHTSNDMYWGDGGKNGGGKNRLGVLLMQVRNQFKNKKQ